MLYKGILCLVSMDYSKECLNLIDDAPTLVCCISNDFKFVFANNSTCKYFKYTKQEILGIDFLNYIFESDKESFLKSINTLTPDNDMCIIKHRVFVDNEIKWNKWTHKAIFNDNGEIIYYSSIGEDITDFYEMYQFIKVHKKGLETIHLGITIADINRNILYVNHADANMHGYNIDELVGKTSRIFAPQQFWREVDVEHLKKVKSWDRETINVKKDGTVFPVELVSDVFSDENGNPIGIITCCKDISEQKKIEEQLRKSLVEKELLLREIHHRVKNNLQLISTLLNLQSKYINNQQILDFFKESQDRIKTISLIHEILYQSNDLSCIYFKKFVQKIISYIVSTYGINKENLSIKLDIDEINLNIDVSIPLGLIINELFTNSIKHAFKNRTNNMVKVSLKKENNTYQLLVSDNGKGFEFNDISVIKTLGLKLVYILTQQLKGNLTIENDNGAKFLIIFTD